MKRAFKYTASYYRQKKKLCRKGAIQVSQEVDDMGNLENSKDNYCCTEENQQDPEENKTGEHLEIPEIEAGLEAADSNEEAQEEVIVEKVDSSSEDEEKTQSSFEEKLGIKIKKFLPKWVLQYQIPHNAVNSLLQNLISCGLSELPKDCRTFICTPKTVDIETMGNGYFWYHGLENCLYGIENYIDKNELHIPRHTLNLSFNINGLPIANSSKSQFWPIFVRVTNVKQFSPQIIAIFSGDSKPPSVEEYLRKFVNELQKLLESGIKINDIVFSIKIHNFVCDTPARSFIKSYTFQNLEHKFEMRGFVKIDIDPNTDLILEVD